MNKRFDMELANKYLRNWQVTLKLQDWDIKLFEVNRAWRKQRNIIGKNLETS